jgi:ribosome-binding protein aMBF1 (putative translation factor)
MRAKKSKPNGRKPNGLMSETRPRAKAAPRSDAKSFRRALGDRVRQARRRSQLSVEELAEKARLAPDLLKKIERGEAPELTAVALEALAAALGLDVMDLGRRRGSRGA